MKSIFTLKQFRLLIPISILWLTTGCAKKMFVENRANEHTDKHVSKSGAIAYPDGNIFYPDGSVRTSDGIVWPSGTYSKSNSKSNNNLGNAGTTSTSRATPTHKTKNDALANDPNVTVVSRNHDPKTITPGSENVGKSKLPGARKSNQQKNTGVRTDANGGRHARKRGERYWSRQLQ
ncbi:MAG: hypothetical protein ABIQ56_00120 [Chitinophagaceae bacterium]